LLSLNNHTKVKLNNNYFQLNGNKIINRLDQLLDYHVILQEYI